MDWRIKAIIQAVLSRTPGGPSMNDFLQRVAGGRRMRNLRSTIDSQLEEVRSMVRALASCGFSFKNACVLELGTGWEPTIAMCIAGLGAQVTTIDIRRNLRPSRYARIKVAETYESIRAETSFSPGQVEAIKRHADGRMEVDVLLKELNITYHAPVPDSFLLTMPERRFDLVFSIAVLEHVPPLDIELLLQGQNRVLKPQGLAYHDIGPGDHAAGFDRNVSYVNFLKYNGPFWKFMGESALQYHNRLRRSDYDQAFDAHGLKQIWTERKICERSKAELRSGIVRPIARFAAYDIEDLATYRVRVVLAVKP